MGFKQLIYRIIYHDNLNVVFRNVNKLLRPLLPEKVKLPPSGIFTMRAKNGNSIKVKTNQTNYLTQLVYWNGLEQFKYTELFLNLNKNINVFYDIGANIGYYSLLAAMENPDIKVVGFEPASGPLYYFQENVRINNFKNIRIESIALSEKEGVITFYEIKNKKYKYLEHNLAGEGNAGSLTEGRNFQKVDVKTTTLDDYVANHEQGKVDLIKMDTEGTEHFILENGRKMLREMEPIVICETLFNTIEPELETIFSSLGYKFYNHTDSGLKKVEHITRSIDNGVRNCFFVPPSKEHLVAEFVTAN